MKYLLNFEDLTEDFSIYLESEDFELENDFTNELVDDLDESDELYEKKKSGVTESLRKKSKASGIPMGILRKVFAKGMGRVNSFITGAGGARKADADLWAKAKAAKDRKKKKK